MEIVRKNIVNDLDYLRQISKPVDFLKDDYKDIIKSLKDFCYLKRENILAIASVQLGIPLRLVYVRNTNKDELFDQENDESIVLINPVILKKEGLTRFYECCESCLDYMGLVERPYRIEVEYFDENKVKKNVVFEGFPATVISHEIDHLDGILHIDKSIDLYDMPFEERKEFRKTHKYEILKKDGEFKTTTDKYVSIDDIKKLAKRI